ncbi:MAG: hypothetical protein VX254_00505 [Planctomycetota bacterium]|nr:hypothetical protein [Planctomycetota bacterium]
MSEKTRVFPTTTSGLQLAPSQLQELPVCSVLPRGMTLLGCEVSLQADGYDHLEIVFSADGASLEVEEVLDSLVPGAELVLELPAGPLFRGRIRDRGLRRDRSGRVGVLRAHCEQGEASLLLQPQTFYHHCDSELAGRLALELGLEPVVEPTAEVIELLDCPGDRLEFLRLRARAIGYEFAATAGRLYFSSKLPAGCDVPGLPPCAGVLALDDLVLEFSIEEHSARGKGGFFELAGDPGWLPLQEFEIASRGGFPAGRYRVARARHCWDRLGYRTRVDYLEHGVDLAGWNGGENGRQD